MKIVIDGKPMDIEPGVPFMSGGKLFIVCPDCGKLVRADKPIFGDLHFCE